MVDSKDSETNVKTIFVEEQRRSMSKVRKGKVAPNNQEQPTNNANVVEINKEKTKSQMRKLTNTNWKDEEFLPWMAFLLMIMFVLGTIIAANIFFMKMASHNSTNETSSTISTFGNRTTIQGDKGNITSAIFNATSTFSTTSGSTMPSLPIVSSATTTETTTEADYTDFPIFIPGSECCWSIQLKLKDENACFNFICGTYRFYHISEENELPIYKRDMVTDVDNFEDIYLYSANSTRDYDGWELSKDLENGYDIQAFTYDYSKCPSYTIDWYYHNNGWSLIDTIDVECCLTHEQCPVMEGNYDW